MKISLKNKVAIITGASQGLGAEVARAYAQAGASLLLCARDGTLLEKVKRDIQARFSTPVEAVQADVSSPQDVEKIMSRTLDRFGTVDVLVNNAGVQSVFGNVEEVAWEAWMRVMEINLYGSVLMARAVVPIMKSKRAGKIIQLSGGGATKPMMGISAYAVSKAAVVRFAETLAEEVRACGIDVNSVAPGMLNTRLMDEVLEAGAEKVGKIFFEQTRAQKEKGGAGFDSSIALMLFLASEKSNGITGKLISALWDHWDKWPKHLEELDGSDVYTLRRITGRERGMEWGDK